MSKSYLYASAFFVLVFVGVQWGFYKHYTSEFPEFKSWEMTHHIHGALMMSWLAMLIIQPIFIATRKVGLHKAIGKLAYIIGPLLTIYMFMTIKLGYNRYFEIDPVDALAVMTLDVRGLVFFTLLYVLALYFRKNTAYHMRFMIGTGILMIGPGFGRAFENSLGMTSWNSTIYSDYIALLIAALLLAFDIYRKNSWVPYSIVTLILVIEVVLVHYRYSATWQTFAAWFASAFY